MGPESHNGSVVDPMAELVSLMHKCEPDSEGGVIESKDISNTYCVNGSHLG